MPEKNQPNISRRHFLKTTLGGGAGFLLLGPAACSPKLRSGNSKWRFVQITDPHNGTEEAAEHLEFVLRDIAQNFPQTQFILTTGDISEHGWADELDENYAIMEASEFTYYNIMGNHDSRWSRTGRQAFLDRFGGPHFAIEHPYLNILAIDSSVLLEQYGYLDPGELTWVEDHLKHWHPKPCILAFHHPPSLPGRYIGSEYSLYTLIAQYNIPAVLAGHIHSQRSYRVNNCQIITAGSTHPPEKGYKVYQVSENAVTVSYRNPVEKITKTLGTINTKHSETTDHITLDGVEMTSSDVRFPTSQMPGDDIDVFINGNMINPTRTREHITVNTDDLGDGDYEMLVCYPNETSGVQRRKWGHFTKDTESVPLRWQKQFPSGIQCAPAYFEETLITGTNAGKVCGLSKKSGDIQWEQSFDEGAILSGPVIENEKLYFGTPSGTLYCAEPSTGEILWSTGLTGSVIATAKVTREAIFVGTGDGFMYKLRPDSGNVVWKFRAGNMIKATPAFDGVNIYFGAWDGFFYCLRVKDGTVVWNKYINTPHYSPATSNPQLVDGLLYLVSHDYRTHCLYAETGDVVWQFPGADVDYQWDSPIVKSCKPSYSSAIFNGQEVFFCSLTGHVVAFDRQTGKQTAEIPLSGPVFDSFPVRVKNRMYFGTTRGALCAVNLDSKQIEWEYSTGYEFIFSGAATDGESLAIGNLGGTLTTISLKT